MPTLPASLPLALLAAATATLGVYLGEALDAPLPGAPAAAAAALCLLPLLGRTSLRWRVTLTALLLTCLCTGWWFGRSSSHAAFNALVRDGEQVREALARHHAQTGAYPSSLAQLGATLPGQRWLRGSLLHYQPTEAGYALRFSDWLVSHAATDSEPFTAQK